MIIIHVPPRLAPIPWTGPETMVDTLSFDAGDPLRIVIVPGPSELMAGLGSWGNHGGRGGGELGRENG